MSGHKALVRVFSPISSEACNNVPPAPVCKGQPSPRYDLTEAHEKDTLYTPSCTSVRKRVRQGSFETLTNGYPEVADTINSKTS